MITYEILAVRKGSRADMRTVELGVKTATLDQDEEGPRINNTIHIEATKAKLDLIFGTDDWDVTTVVRLNDVEFAVEEPAA